MKTTSTFRCAGLFVWSVVLALSAQSTVSAQHLVGTWQDEHGVVIRFDHNRIYLDWKTCSYNYTPMAAGVGRLEVTESNGAVGIWRVDWHGNDVQVLTGPDGQRTYRRIHQGPPAGQQPLPMQGQHPGMHIPGQHPNGAQGHLPPQHMDPAFLQMQQQMQFEYQMGLEQQRHIAAMERAHQQALIDAHRRDEQARFAEQQKANKVALDELRRENEQRRKALERQRKQAERNRLAENIIAPGVPSNPVTQAGGSVGGQVITEMIRGRENLGKAFGF